MALVRHVLCYTRPNGDLWHVAVAAESDAEARQMGDELADQLNADNPDCEAMVFVEDRGPAFPHDETYAAEVSLLQRLDTYERHQRLRYARQVLGET